MAAKYAKKSPAYAKKLANDLHAQLAETVEALVTSDAWPKLLKTMAERSGATIKTLCWTIGRYDVIAVFEAPAEPLVEIGLQLGQAVVELLTERNPIELVEHRLVEALANSVRLRALGLGPAVVDILDREIQFVLVPLRVAAVLTAAIGEHPAERDGVLLIERQHPVIQQIRRGDRRLDVVKLGEADLGVGIDEGLLVDAAHSLQRADVKGILCAAITWAFAIELAVRFLCPP